MSPDTVTSPDDAGAAVNKFEFTGSAGEMWPIIFKNLLLNIITLSFYRFWGRTNIRRYLWSNVRFMGDPLEYTGRGGELFVGFLIVFVVVFIPLVALLSWAQTLMIQGDTLGYVIFGVTYGFLFWLMPLGLYRAFKYRMSRTRWRGIRGAQLESGVRYATEFFGFMIPTLLTAGLLMPVMENRLFTLESDNRRFGTGRFSYDGGAKKLYGGFLTSYAIVIAGYVAVFGGMFIATKAAGDATGQPSMIESSLPLITILVFYVILGLAFIIYEFTKLSHFWNNTKFENAEFAFSGTKGDLFRLYLGNILLTIVTLGIAYPIAQMRIVRFMAENVMLKGELDLSAISQSEEAEPEFGEGLAEGFDMGTI